MFILEQINLVWGFWFRSFVRWTHAKSSIELHIFNRTVKYNLLMSSFFLFATVVVEKVNKTRYDST